MTNQRPLHELIERHEPGIDQINQWIREATNHVTVLEVARDAGERTLSGLQVTSRSPLGAMALETGGLMVDHGWLRLLGGGCSRQPRTLHEWNRPHPETQRLPGCCLVGDDVLGGFFAINGDGLKGAPGHVFYCGPDTLAWLDVAPSYSDWLIRVFDGDLELFYEGLRWPGWQRDVATLRGDQGFSVFPLLCTEETPMIERSRATVPIEELWTLHAGLREQLGGA